MAQAADRRVGGREDDAALRWRALIAWCVMVNHVHAIVLPHHPYDVSSILHSWKSFSAQRCNALLGRNGAFWEADYFDRVARDEGHLALAVEYVEMNPVAAGLCAEPHEWWWSSAYRRAMQ
ncbi:MAG: transposase [Armatimonadia bacterium]